MNMPPGLTTAMIPTVLVVDDVPANLDVLITALRDENFALVAAISGEEGIEVAKSMQPDLILLDIMMPGMDGYETCRRLKADPATADIPVVFLSAQDEEVDLERGLLLGAVDYVIKPFSIPVLKARMRNHLALKHKSQLLARLAWTDEVTGVANRRYFELVCEREWLRAKRNGEPLSFVMIGVDDIESINDCHGQQEGDACLQKIVSSLAAVLRRPADLLARYDSKEFFALLPGTDSSGAKIMAEHIRRAVLNISGVASQGHKKISISLGCSTMASDKPLSGLLNEAAEALCLAKRTGQSVRVALET